MTGDLDDPVYLEIEHQDVRWVDQNLFLLTFAPDCMAHECRCRDEGNRRLLDACCQHGADVDLFERDAILRRTREVASVMPGELKQTARWFDEREPEADVDAPSGTIVRTATLDLEDEASGCVFLHHGGGRGCALHRAAVEHGFDPAEIKPLVCRLYPISWGEQTIGLSDDFARYDCATAAGPTVYRLMRSALLAVFGVDLVRQLDRLERQILPRKLPLLASG